MPTVSGDWVDYGTDGSSKAGNDRCMVEITNGVTLFNGSYMGRQQSCEPHSYNAGNYYDYFVAKPDSSNNSLCPSGWGLVSDSRNIGINNLLLHYNINTATGASSNTYDKALINFPLSFLKTGAYYKSGMPNGRGSYGFYHVYEDLIIFSIREITIGSGNSQYAGPSLRCFFGRWEIFDNRGGGVSKRAGGFRKMGLFQTKHECYNRGEAGGKMVIKRPIFGMIFSHINGGETWGN